MFWIRVDVREESGQVRVTTFSGSAASGPNLGNPIRHREASTVSQALRKLAAAMVTAKAETCGENGLDALQKQK